ncbi:Uncharacterised protein [Mycobacteroides abscessus subsp. abscessus]|uniref:hypothetical protein n=1 Tax=Mycobacteroides abscessus TaxID=36809 RepID=UPI00092B0335|nr:hypothetical protein [Mycobacteroides abscessus]SHW33219.1 Uncharacterised protein [Mycobacteroides abscessus subsp. abscessus]SHW52561.1 Uncharacterised protein [Mycobacteroides abscessus subsp. abscessus]SIC47177.1 Uncharacterised protein [Mycobacteroides abscessus subsp. abscessus]SKV57117.1 Uncharacterised protein [Mycobacteroides abscessus subsp. abscessus]
MSEPWEAESLGGGRFRFKNTSGDKLAMIVLAPVDGAEVSVDDGPADDPHVVPAPVEPGDSFTAVVRGAGVRITSTAVPAMTHVYWELGVS